MKPLALAGEMVANRNPHYVTTVGVDFLAEALDDVELRRVLFDAHLLVAEEKAVVWASVKILGNPLPANVTVPGLIPRLFALAEEKNWRVFLLGVDDPVAEKVRASASETAIGRWDPSAGRQTLVGDGSCGTSCAVCAKRGRTFCWWLLGSPKQEKSGST